MSLNRVSIAVFLLFTAVSGFAESVLNANDLPVGALTAPAAFDDFVILAKADKAVNIEAIAGRSAEGEVFNARIKLNGGGSNEFRAIRLVTQGKARLTLYTNSSSKTEPRVLKVVDAAGTVLAELTAPVDDDVNAGVVGTDLPAAGTYFVFSATGGINLYQVTVK